MSDRDDSFFSVAGTFELLADPISPDQLWLDSEALAQAMPTAFRLMSQVTELEQQCLPLLQGLEQHSKALAQYLKLQADKIDLVLQHHLAQDPNAAIVGQGRRFGGSAIEVNVAAPLAVGSALSLRLFLREENIAIFAHGEVTGCDAADHGFNATIRFTSISEQAQEQLVRASLQVQQRQLRQRAQLRSNAL
ncbi:PilZ domain-containing protein [Ferrimonas senticii]|uniref:PilZ domain-containing protein n=1 Tax=Ferrimonas senticii TaxID=394566 RepID=UPI00047F2AC7|nr:PilZ domain-containing protein [Ferrimonas senticii]